MHQVADMRRSPQFSCYRLSCMSTARVHCFGVVAKVWRSIAFDCLGLYCANSLLLRITRNFP